MKKYLLIPFLLLCSVSAQAKDFTFTPPSVFLEELTWQEVKQAMEDGYTRILIPTAGTEQNGAHLVLGKHHFVMRHTAEQIAKRLGKTLVAPIMDYVPEEAHMAYAGTISLSEDTFEAVLEDTADSLKQHGFTQIYFVGESYGNQKPQEEVVEDLQDDFAKDDVKIASLNHYYDPHYNGQIAWLKNAGYTEAQIGGHAGIRDTSEMLAAYPKGVRKDKIKDSGFEDRSGANGAATKASVVYGHKMLELKIRAAIKQVETLERKKTPRN